MKDILRKQSTHPRGHAHTHTHILHHHDKSHVNRMLACARAHAPLCDARRCVCLLLLGLDVVWWREHARTGAEHRSSSGDAGSAGSGGGGEADGDAVEMEGSLLLPRTSEAGAADAAGPTPSGDYAIDVPSRSPGEDASCMGDEGDGDGAGGCAGSRRGGEDRFGTDLLGCCGLRTAPSVIGLDSL